MTQVLIIEDEAKAARELGNLLRNVDMDIEISAVLESVEQAIAWFAENGQPDLIFSGIQLADGLCFDIFGKKSEYVETLVGAWPPSLPRPSLSLTSARSQVCGRLH